MVSDGVDVESRPASTRASGGVDASLQNDLTVLSRSMETSKSISEFVLCARQLLMMRSMTADVLFRLQQEGSSVGFNLVSCALALVLLCHDCCS